jgi:hypothetical protein
MRSERLLGVAALASSAVIAVGPLEETDGIWAEARSSTCTGEEAWWATGRSWCRRAFAPRTL